MKIIGIIWIQARDLSAIKASVVILSPYLYLTSLDAFPMEIRHKSFFKGQSLKVFFMTSSILQQLRISLKLLKSKNDRSRQVFSIQF